MTSITEPGIYDGLPAEVYHADPVPGGSLSSSGARRLLNCPLKFAEGEDKTTSAMERGTAAHTRVLGAGPELHVIEADNWRKDATKEEAEEARLAGEIPVLAAQAAKINGMVLALQQHRAARELLTPGSGLPEQSLFWKDERWDIWRRSRIDFLPFGANGLVIVADYKTAENASRSAMSRSANRYGYHLQADWYCEAVETLRPGIEARFALIVQETELPYAVACYYFDGPAMAQAHRRNQRACEMYRDCKESGKWPGYDPAEGIQPLSLPGYAYYDEEWDS